MKLRLLFLFIAAASFAMLTACGSSGPLTVTLSSAPSTLSAGATTSITATVAHDSKNGGVVFSLACATTGQCGSITSGVIASGTAVTYQAPTSVLTGAVTITATAVDNTQVSASATVTIGPPSAVLPDGSYVFQLFGEDVNGSFHIAGALTISGGAITNGEQDWVDPQFEDLDQNMTGTMTATTDGNLQLVITTGDSNIGPSGNAGVETINVTPTASAAASAGPSGLLTWFDGFASATGNIRSQNATAAAALPSAGYAFYTSGVDSSGTNFLTIGGIVNVDDLNSTTGTISGAGSEFDVNDEGSVTMDQGFANTSTVAGPSSAPTAPDSFGRVTFTLVGASTNTYLPSPGTLALAGYIVDSNRVFLVETADTLGATTGGTAYAQGSNTDTFSNSTTAFGGATYVLGGIGADVNGALNFVGDITFTPTTGSTTAGTVSGTVDFNDIAAQVPQATITAGSYTIDPTGFVTVTGLVFTLGKESSNQIDIQFYLDGNGNAVAASMDSFDVTEGLAFEAVAGTSIAGAYGLAGGGVSAATTHPWSAVGPTVVTGGSIVATTPPPFTDFNYFDPATPADSIQVTDVPLTGTVVYSSATPPVPPTITGLGADSILAESLTSDTFDFYVIDATRAFGIETDAIQTGLLYLEFQDPQE